MIQKFKNWTGIYNQLLQADKNQSLEPKDLEKLALAAYLTGKDKASFQILERAHQGYSDKGNKVNAVRCAFWLGLMNVNTGQHARGSGWFARGERLLSDIPNPNCPEKRLLFIPQALGELGAGHGAKAQQIFEAVASAGEQFQDADLMALGRLGLGQSLIQQGEIAKGIKLLDETMITIETEDVFPIVNGIVYCAVIESCRKIWDLERAQEWTAALSRWCDAQPDLVPFRGECLVQRAEIFQFHGEWHKALEETIDACSLLTQSQGRPAAGEAYYRQADLHRLVGNFTKAEECYHEAVKRGRNPQPGLALLRLAQERTNVAETAIRNTLQETIDPKRRAELLPAVVHIMLAAKKTENAHKAEKELCIIARDFNVPYLLAMCSYCQGKVSFAEGNKRAALEHLQKALKFWNSLNLPYESAFTREIKGIVYREMNDRDSSETELIAAGWIYEQLGAIPDLERINRLLNRKRQPETFGLSLRELQVLNLVASGKTNKLIANELFISRRTVDRHVSNILTKLDVSSRVEATAFALKNQMLDTKF
ncbi:response regulator transcription factor [Maribellus mangrovi]|uniref:response regulator transcription factor n=1 Tax=Maribellus mangrovi TaxID=3133146 RepID=UPI0030ED7C47